MSTNIKVPCVKCTHVNEYRPVDFEKRVTDSGLTKEAFLAQFLCRTCRSASGVKVQKVAKLGKSNVVKPLTKAQRYEAELARENTEKVGYLSAKEEAEVIKNAIHESDITVSVRETIDFDKSKMENISSISDITSGDILFDTENNRFFEITTTEDGVVVGHELGIRESVNVNFVYGWMKVKEEFVKEVV